MNIGRLPILFLVLAAIMIAISAIVTVYLIKYLRSDKFTEDSAERAAAQLKKLRNSLIACYALAAALITAAAVIKLISVRV